MPLPFYLDAARMGLMTPSTQLALQDFVRHVGENGCTLYFEKFLKDGWQAWPHSLRAQYPGLHSWNGIRELKKAVRQIAGAAADAPLFLAGRTTKLIELAAKAMFRSCRRVLLTDLTWPSYGRIFHRFARRFGRQVLSVAIRPAIFNDGTEPESIAKRIADFYLTHRCEGMLLPEISHDGIRLPWQSVTNLIRKKRDRGLTIIDGGQSFGHVPVNLSSPGCDFYVTGCHKWVGAHLPMGIGICPRPETAHRFRHATDGLDDPLLRFLERVDERKAHRFSETVNLTPLFPCRTALGDLGVVDSNLVHRQQNAAAFLALLDLAWQPKLPHESFRAGTVLVKSVDSRVQKLEPDDLRALFLHQGVALTAYAGGLLRLAMPATSWSLSEAAAVAKAFRNVGDLAR